jgi:phosphoglycolate phosphatase
VTPALIVFDLDGTLIDSRRDLADSANELIGRYAGPALPIDQVTGMVGEGARMLIARAFAAAGLDASPDEALPAFLEIYGRRLFDHTRPYQGVEDMLRAAAAVAPLAVLTNKPQQPADRLIAHFGFDRFVGRVVGGDAGFPRKPAPDSLLALASEAGAEAARTLLVGDSWIDHETAERAGALVCLARYGFGWARFDPARLRGDEWIIDAPRDLAPLISPDVPRPDLEMGPGP